MPAKVLIVDDSALMREVLTSIINSDPELSVVDTAMDPIIAREKIKKHNPDVVTLDIEMPRMSGLDFLKKIMALRPTPVVMVSSLTTAGAKAAIEALEIGAIDTIGKPVTGGAGLWSLRDEIIDKIKAAADSRLMPPTTVQTTVGADQAFDPGRIIAIGASTGGIPAVQSILQSMPQSAPPIVVVQHMPEGFTTRFAQRLRDLCAIEVTEATNGGVLQPGCAYIAPAGFQTRVERHGGQTRFAVTKEARVNGFCPSVDVMFTSLAKICRGNAIGAILTGMGYDGARGLLDLRKVGCRTFAQDEGSCVVYGMPRVAVEMGAVDAELPLGKIAGALLNAAVIGAQVRSSVSS